MNLPELTLFLLMFLLTYNCKFLITNPYSYGVCGRGVARLTRPPVTGKIAGSNPVGRANYKARTNFLYCSPRSL